MSTSGVSRIEELLRKQKQQQQQQQQQPAGLNGFSGDHIDLELLSHVEIHHFRQLIHISEHHLRGAQ